MNMLIDAAKQALEALEIEDSACRHEKEITPEHIASSITVLRQAIEQAEKQDAELRRLHEFKLAHKEWVAKTDWMKAAPFELGMHKADVLKQRIDRLHEVNKELLEALKWAVDCLHFDSSMPEAMANLDSAYAAIAKARGAE